MQLTGYTTLPASGICHTYKAVFKPMLSVFSVDIGWQSYSPTSTCATLHGSRFPSCTSITLLPRKTSCVRKLTRYSESCWFCRVAEFIAESQHTCRSDSAVLSSPADVICSRARALSMTATRRTPLRPQRDADRGCLLEICITADVLRVKLILRSYLDEYCASLADILGVSLI